MDIEVIPQNLGEMDSDVWEMFSSGAEQKYKKRIREEKKAEKDRLAVIEADKVERERIEAENEKLKKENAEREEKEQRDRDTKILDITARQIVAKDFLFNLSFTEFGDRFSHAETGCIVPHSDFSRLEYEIDLDAFKERVLFFLKNEREKIAAKKEANAEREAREKLEQEAREKEEAEKEAEETKKADEANERLRVIMENKKAAAAPDKEKILAYLQALDNVPVPELVTRLGKTLIQEFNLALSKLQESIIEELENA